MTSKKSNGKSEFCEEEKAVVEDDVRLKLRRKIIIDLSCFNTLSGVQYIMLGICAKVFCEEKVYLFIFGMLCLLHIINAPFVYMSLKKSNRSFFLVIALLNLVWITATAALLLIYNILLTNQQFDNDLTFHVSSLFYIAVSIVLVICFFLEIKNLDNTSRQSVQPKDQKPDEQKCSKSKEKSSKNRSKPTSQLNLGKGDKKGNKLIPEVSSKVKDDEEDAQTKH